MTDAHVFAVAALGPDLFDRAVAGGEDRRAHRRPPIDAGMNLSDMKQRMDAPAERRGLEADRDRLAHQEFLRAFAAIVIIVVLAVVGGAEVVVFLALAADGQRRIAHLMGAVAVGVLGIEHVERVARLHFALEVDIVGIDADHFVDHRLRNVVAQRGLVQALIERHAAVRLIDVLVLARCGRYRYRRCGYRPAHRCPCRTKPPPPGSNCRPRR